MDGIRFHLLRYPRSIQGRSVHRIFNHNQYNRFWSHSQIGFLNAITKDSCYKIVRDLLVNITTKQTDLISCLLLMMKQNFRSVDKYATYLFKSLPLDQWHPPIETFEIAANWLLNFGFETSENAMARTIFSRLNWNFDKKTNELFLPHEIHIRMACLIVEVSSKHVPETIGLSGISESVRQVSNMMKGQSPQQQFSSWCWNMVAVLRLHCFDQSNEFIRRTIRNPQDALRHVSEIERLLAIAEGVVDNRPLAVYLSILTTLWGHSVPQICHKGFDQMQNLLNDYRHSSVIRCLQLVTPFFLECPDSLSKCHAFQTILVAILAADRTYIRMAKDFISNDYLGPVVELFANMIQAQIIDYAQYGLSTPTMFINLWLTNVMAIPNWYKDMNAVRIVDLILRIAFQFPDAWFMAQAHFEEYCKLTNESKPSQSSAFIPFLSSPQPTGLLATPSPIAPWLALLILEVEHETYELDTKLWPEVVRQLRLTSTKFSMDSVIKTAAKAVGTTACAANSLVIYKVGNLILSCAYTEPVLPILCQLFFRLYLTRIRYTSDEMRFNDWHGVADKFYEHNVSMMKKLKRYFVDGAKYKSDRDDDEVMRDRSRLFHSFELWLEETRLNQYSHIASGELPHQYDLNRLTLIFANSTVSLSQILAEANYWPNYWLFPIDRPIGRSSLIWPIYGKRNEMKPIHGCGHVSATYRRTNIPSSQHVARNQPIPKTVSFVSWVRTIHHSPRHPSKSNVCYSKTLNYRFRSWVHCNMISKNWTIYRDNTIWTYKSWVHWTATTRRCCRSYMRINIALKNGNSVAAQWCRRIRALVRVTVRFKCRITLSTKWFRINCKRIVNAMRCSSINWPQHRPIRRYCQLFKFNIRYDACSTLINTWSNATTNNKPMKLPISQTHSSISCWMASTTISIHSIQHRTYAP